MQTKPTSSDSPAICSSSAFIDVNKYAVPPLKNKSDKAYHQWVADWYLKPMPEILGAYTDLRECWDHYHPTQK